MTLADSEVWAENLLRTIETIDSSDIHREKIKDVFNQLNQKMKAVDRNTFQTFNEICPRIINDLKVHIMLYCVFLIVGNSFIFNYF